MLTYIQGDIRNTDCKNIAHGVNCRNRMGSGVAKALYEKWPVVKEQFHERYMQERNILGTVQPVVVESDGRTNRWVLNMFTQENYGYDGRRYVNYAALVHCFTSVLTYGLKELAIPKIGCGLAGGDWDIVSQLIEDSVNGAIDIKVYCYE